jgi:hypothetical protein
MFTGGLFRKNKMADPHAPSTRAADIDVVSFLHRDGISSPNNLKSAVLRESILRTKPIEFSIHLISGFLNQFFASMFPEHSDRPRSFFLALHFHSKPC